jgi:hypothetical protein
MNYSVREFRHIVGRFLHAHGCSRHLANPLRDLLLSAQADGFDVLTELERTRPEIAGFTGALAATGATSYDACGQAAYAVGPDLIDRLVVAAAAADGSAAIVVAGATGTALLSHLADYARLRGLDGLQVELGADGARISGSFVGRPAGLPARVSEGPGIAAALVSGFDAEVDQFWRLFYESNEALTPDSELSRQHAGAQLRDAEGNVIGEVDEESYLYIRSQAEQADEVASRC